MPPPPSLPLSEWAWRGWPPSSWLGSLRLEAVDEVEAFRWRLGRLAVSKAVGIAPFRAAPGFVMRGLVVLGFVVLGLAPVELGLVVLGPAMLAGFFNSLLPDAAWWGGILMHACTRA